MDDIKAWLNGGQDYHTGCDLIIRHHPNKALHQVFREAATPYKVQRLKKELLALVTSEPRPIQLPNFHRVVAGTPSHVREQVVGMMDALDRANGAPINRWGPPEQMPPVVHALWLEWKPLYSERNSIMARIFDVAHAGLTNEGEKQKAGEMAHKILQLDDQVEAIYKKRAHYIATGALPVAENAPDDLVVDPKKIPTALQNAKRYVREFTRKLKTAPQNAAFAQKLEHWQKRVDHYQTILNG